MNLTSRFQIKKFWITILFLNSILLVILAWGNACQQEMKSSQEVSATNVDPLADLALDTKQVYSGGLAPIRIVSRNLSSNASIKIGTETCLQITQISTNEIECTLPALAPGLYDFSIITDQGKKTLPEAIEVIDYSFTETLAGKSGELGNTDGKGLDARFYQLSTAWRSGDEVFLTDESCHLVRHVHLKTKKVSTYAGSSDCSGPSYADGATNLARFSRPTGVSGDASSIYIADTNNGVIRRINRKTGVVTTLAGQAGNLSYTDGPTGVETRFVKPLALASSDKFLFVADEVFVGFTVIREIDKLTGETKTLVGQTTLPAGASNSGWRPILDQVTMLANALESPHTYPNGISMLYGPVQHNGAKYIRPYFEKLELEDGSDFLDVLDGNGNVVATLTGNLIESYGPIVPGDKFSVRLRTDNSLAFYGFKIIKYASSNNEKFEHSDDGIGSAAKIGQVQAMMVLDEHIYFTDSGTRSLRQVSIATKQVKSLAGSGNPDSIQTKRGEGHLSDLFLPKGLTADANYFYLLDANPNSNSIVRVSRESLTTDNLIVRKSMQASADLDGSLQESSLVNGLGLFYHPSAGLYFYGPTVLRVVR